MTPESRSKHVHIDGLGLHYLEWGSPRHPVLVCLHGTGDNCHIWDHFSSVASRHLRIIALDQRGHGESDWSAKPSYRCVDYVGDLERFIEALELNNVLLMGHSMGALHATAYASMKPEKVSALIHVDIEPRPPAWNKKYLQGLYENLPHAYDSVKSFVKRIKSTSPYASEELLSQFARFALEQRQDGKYYSKAHREVYSSFDEYDLRDRLGLIRCPVLVVRGEESRVMTAEAAREMTRALPGGKLVEIPQATHPVLTDNPETFAATIFEFLNDLGLVARSASF